MHTIRNTLVLILSLAVAGTASAAPFNTFDPVSMAKGGVGVAMPNPSNATLFNPAQLSAMPEHEDFAIGFSLGGRGYDPDDTVSTIDDAGHHIDRIDALVEEINMGNDTQENREELARLVRRLDRDLQGADGNIAQAEAGVALLANRPSKRFGVGLTGGAQLYVGGQLDYTENDSNLFNDLADDAEAGRPVSFDEADLTSEGEALGVAIGEVGVTFSREVEFRGHRFAVGLTPKYMRIETIRYAEGISSADSDDFDAEEYRKSHTDVNVDLGLLKVFDSGLHTGVVVKNLIPRDYDTVELNGQKETVKLNPQVRAGVGFEGGWYRVGADLDVTANQPVAFEDKSRYIGVGGELDAWGWAQLRAGYRLNTEDSDRNVASLGVGLSPFRVIHIDIGVAGNSNEVGGSANLSMTF